MSYPNYLEDRRRLGFRCIADQNSSVVSDLKNVLKIAGKILVLYPIKKGKKIFVRIFSKETLIASLLFVKAFYIDIYGNLSHKFSVTSPTYVTKLSNFQVREKYFKSSSILKFRGGSQDSNLIEEKQEIEDEIDWTQEQIRRQKLWTENKSPKDMK